VSIGRCRSKKQRKLTRPEYRDPCLSDIGSSKIIISCGSADTLFAAVLHAGDCWSVTFHPAAGPAIMTSAGVPLKVALAPCRCLIAGAGSRAHEGRAPPRPRRLRLQLAKLRSGARRAGAPGRENLDLLASRRALERPGSPTRAQGVGSPEAGSGARTRDLTGASIGCGGGDRLIPNPNSESRSLRHSESVHVHRCPEIAENSHCLTMTIRALPSKSGPYHGQMRERMWGQNHAIG